MSFLSFESPLAWPEGLVPTPRASQSVEHGFPQPLNLSESIAFLEQEIKTLGGSAILFTDIAHPTVDRLRRKVGSRSGASLRLRYQGRFYVLACDRWQTVEHNIYALHLALRQMQNIERWGAGTVAALLSGFGTSEIALPEQPEVLPWMESLGLGPTATLDDAVAVYHRRAKQLAQDDKALMQLNILMEEARAWFAAKS